ncbi:MAG TPA: ATP-binding cassette domain-containing protein [Conexibacter sp.]|nr:ATP-binding cassette domain-containing protein [Conexibacter sp.]
MTLLAFDGVWKTLRRPGPEHEVLRDVSFDVREGQFVGIVGPRGSGKSMLLQIAAGMSSPDRGTVAFAGRDLNNLSRRGLAALRARQIGWGCLIPPPAGLTIRDSLTFSLRTHPGCRSAEGTVDVLLEELGLRELAGATWNQLTLSEKGRAALAQAVIRRPRLLLVDDLLAGTDLVRREQTLTLLRSWSVERGLAILMVASDAPHLLHCDEIMVLSNGSLLKPSLRSGADVIAFPTTQTETA